MLTDIRALADQFLIAFPNINNGNLVNLDKKITMSTLSTLLSGLHLPYTSLYFHFLYTCACVVALVTGFACVAC